MGSNMNKYQVKFSKGSLPGFHSRYEPVLEIKDDDLIPLELLSAYKSGVAKLTTEEKQALRVH